MDIFKYFNNQKIGHAALNINEQPKVDFLFDYLLTYVLIKGSK